MDKRMIGLSFGTLLCAAGVVQGQLHHPHGKAINKPPVTLGADMTAVSLTPKGEADLVAVGRLDQAAMAAVNSGDYAEAEADARQSVSLGVFSGRGQELLAAALDAQGKTQEALQTYRVIFDEGDVNPTNELPYALLLLKTGQWSQAVQAYNRQLPYNGGDGTLIQSHSNFTSGTQRPTDLETAIHIGLGMQLGWYEYHGTYQEKTQQALAHFQQALTLEPDSPLANYYYGYGLHRMGRHADAQAAFKQAAALDIDGDVKAAAEDALAGR